MLSGSGLLCNICPDKCQSEPVSPSNYKPRKGEVRLSLPVGFMGFIIIILFVSYI